ncbi:dipeptide ABC transporter ATP-binding protein [Rhodococcus qingshengii]|uniref:dipeptide ABC transporter ATP-binding protein n=1 Tax=Rhodococcus qingshengii TaxID=334542 RepID=UPI001BE5785A|nr:ABC transporter ATP-binding protein [Rhodococcus qingshengii]MBT2270831.1 ABC transporter ATP-binding protein [Rhodococcus qingshengii]
MTELLESPVGTEPNPTSTPLLAIDRLSVSYVGGRGHAVAAVRDVSLIVEAGEFVAVVGESGSGKSTTIHSALRLLPSSARVDGGTVRFRGEDITGWNDKRLAKVRGPFVGFVPQDPGNSLNPVKRVGTQVLDAVGLHRRIGKSAAKAVALEKLRLAGLSDVERLYSQFPHELSGGMKQRVLIAIALANDPELLIADEPTSALDVTVQKVILDHLEHLRSTLGLGILLITHDLGVAAERADRLIVMQGGTIVEQGTTESVVDDPASLYTRQLLAAAPSFLLGRLAPAIGVEPANVDSGDVVLRADGITKYFSVVDAAGARDVFTALEDVSIRLRRGTTHAVVGESGAGKSTLARAVVGLTTPDSGKVYLHDNPISGLSNRALHPVRRRIQLVYQNPMSSLDPRFTIERTIAEPLRTFGIAKDRREIRARVTDLLTAVALGPEYLLRKPAELSGGQRQRVAIARALAADPEVLVLDEAVSALDVSVQDQILRLLVDLQAERGLTYLFVTHDLGVVRLVADDVTVMRAGRTVESGAVQQVLENPSSDYTRALVDAVPHVHRQELVDDHKTRHHTIGVAS